MSPLLHAQKPHKTHSENTKTVHTPHKQEDIYRNLMIFLDYHNAENADLTLAQRVSYTHDSAPAPCGVSAITYGALAALHSESAPAVMSKSLVNNIYNHYRIFDDFVRLSVTELYQKYRMFPRFCTQQSVQTFQQSCRYIMSMYPQVNKELKKRIKSSDVNHLKDIVHQISVLPSFSDNRAPSMIANPASDMKTRNAHNEVSLYFLCHTVCSKLLRKWTVRELNNDIYVCIPDSYEASCTQYKQTLGLNTDQLQRINLEKDCGLSKHIALNTPQPISARPRVDFASAFKKLCTKESLRYKWIVYIDGHGIYSYNIKKELRRFKKMESYCHSLLRQSKFRACRSSEKRRDYHAHASQCPYHHEYQEIKRNINDINTKIKVIKKNIREQKNPFEGTIVSLAVSDFKDLLLALNTNLNTELVYYSSCFAGGEHTVSPYIDKDNKPLKLNYDVVLGTLSETPSDQELPYLGLPPYRECQMCVFTLDPLVFIDPQAKSLRMETNLQFGSFFDYAHKGFHKDAKKQAMLVGCVNPYTDKDTHTIKTGRIRNLPLIREKHTESFKPMINDPRVVYADTQKNITIDSSCYALLLENTHMTKLSLKKTGQNPETAIVSVSPGEAVHDIDHIHAPRYSFIEVINMFSQMTALSASKIFYIKNLTVKTDQTLYNAGIYPTESQTTTLKDVIISYNIHDTGNIKQMMNIMSIVAPQQDEMITGIYFTTSDSRQFSLAWSGSPLNGLQAYIRQTRGREKNKLLAYRQEIKNAPIIA
jgi:hypothetical protein